MTRGSSALQHHRAAAAYGAAAAPRPALRQSVRSAAFNLPGSVNDLGAIVGIDAAPEVDLQSLRRVEVRRNADATDGADARCVLHALRTTRACTLLRSPNPATPLPPPPPPQNNNNDQAASYVSRRRLDDEDFDPDAVDDEGLPLVYNEQRIAAFWSTRPGELASRCAPLLSVCFGVALSVCLLASARAVCCAHCVCVYVRRGGRKSGGTAAAAQPAQRLRGHDDKHTANPNNATHKHT